jgi:hypothetical protein
VEGFFYVYFAGFFVCRAKVVGRCVWCNFLEKRGQMDEKDDKQDLCPQDSRGPGGGSGRESGAC